MPQNKQKNKRKEQIPKGWQVYLQREWSENCLHFFQETLARMISLCSLNKFCWPIFVISSLFFFIRK